MKKTILFTLLITQFYACSSFEMSAENKQNQKFSKFTQKFKNPNHIQKTDEVKILAELQIMTPYIQSLNMQSLNEQGQIPENRDNLYLDFANLNAAYSEYLVFHHCINLSEKYFLNAEDTYLKLLQDSPYDENLLYNISIFYARNSVPFDDDQHQQIRTQLLEKSKQYAEKHQEINTENQQHKHHYYAVLSELLNALDKQKIRKDQQKALIQTLQPFLFELLEQPNMDYDSGNFFILVKYYDQYLKAYYPQQTKSWLKQNQNKILAFYNSHQDENTQRNNTISAQLYALLDQPEKTLYFLKLLKFTEKDNYTPQDILDEQLFDKMRHLKAFQVWFAQYSQEYQAYLKQNPKVCNSLQSSVHSEIKLLNNQRSKHVLEINKNVGEAPKSSPKLEQKSVK